MRRKLRVEPVANGEGRWAAIVERLSRDVHAPDGCRFVQSVDDLVHASELIREPWAGVLHGRAHASAGEQARYLAALRASPVFDANLQTCRGLWTLAADVQACVDAWALPILGSRVCANDADLAEESHAATADTGGVFVQHLVNSAAYRALPVPQSQTGEFRKFDLTLFIISYKRLKNIGPILSSLCRQDFTGSFEVILWNNNPDAAAELDAIVAPFRHDLELTLLHSSRNFYCIVRLAVAHLMRGEALMICDDDIQPSASYVSTFVSGLRSAGERTVVCARGNRFRPHRLNQAAPHRVWEHWDHLDFADVNAPAREVHFMHGSSCLLPRQALLELSAMDLPEKEFILVDDYWLSYALSGVLGWRIWKIQAGEAFRFDKSAEDPAVALFLNPRVREERTNFYVYHMKQGWPAGCGV